jgi:hypothetical protein
MSMMIFLLFLLGFSNDVQVRLLPLISMMIYLLFLLGFSNDVQVTLPPLTSMMIFSCLLRFSKQVLTLHL